MARVRMAALALALLASGLAGAQEIVLTDGSRLPGLVERYENGFAYIRLFREGRKSVLTTMPESSVDKAATEKAQTEAADVPAPQTPESRTGPFKLPHNDLSRATGPNIAAVAAEERERRVEAIDSGAATGRVFKNGQTATGIPGARQIEALADLREQPKAHNDMDAAERIAGLRFYEARLQTLASAFVLLGDEWAEMWSHCTPVTYVGTSSASRAASALETPFPDIVIASFRRPADAPHRMGDNWSISCLRRDSDFVARGRDVVEAYDTVFNAYTDFVTNTGQSSVALARVLPSSPLQANR